MSAKNAEDEILQSIRRVGRNKVARIRRQLVNSTQRTPGIHASDISTAHTCKRKAVFDQIQDMPKRTMADNQLNTLAQAQGFHHAMDLAQTQLRKFGASMMQSEVDVGANIIQQNSNVRVGDMDSIYGRLDAIGAIHNENGEAETSFLIDWKTWMSNPKYPKQGAPKEDHVLQMSIYAALMQMQGLPRIDYGLLIYFDYSKRLDFEEYFSFKLIPYKEILAAMMRYRGDLVKFENDGTLPPVERTPERANTLFPVWLCQWSTGSCPYVDECLTKGANDLMVSKIDKLPNMKLKVKSNTQSSSSPSPSRAAKRASSTDGGKRPAK